MPIAFENSAFGLGYNAVTISSFSAGSNADRIVIVLTNYEALSTGLATASVTYGGVSMTKLTEFTDGQGHKFGLFYLLGADASGDIVTSSDSAGTRKSLHAAAFSGVGGASGYAHEVDGAYSFSVDVASAVGHLAVLFGWNGNLGATPRITPGAGVTEHVDADNTVCSYWLVSKAGASPTTTLTGDYGNFNFAEILSLSLEPAGGGGSSTGAAAHYYRQMQ